MNSTQYYTAIILGVTALIFSVVVVWFSQADQRLQIDVQNRQAVINRASTLQQMITNLLQDMAAASLKDEEIKNLLARHGYTVQVSNPKATPSPAAAVNPASK